MLEIPATVHNYFFLLVMKKRNIVNQLQDVLIKFTKISLGVMMMVVQPEVVEQLEVVAPEVVAQPEEIPMMDHVLIHGNNVVAKLGKVLYVVKME